MGMATWKRSGRFGRLAMAVLLLAIGVAAPACRGQGTGEAAGASETPGGREGMVLPEIAITTLDGSRLTTASLRGKVVIVDFWDTWCGPCLRALPHLKDLGVRHADDVVVVAIALGQEGEAKVRQVAARLELPFAVALIEAQGNLVPAFGNVDQLPTTFLIGPDGVIRRRWVGAQSLPTYENAVKALLSS